MQRTATENMQISLDQTAWTTTHNIQISLVANPARYPQPIIAMIDIQEAAVARLATTSHHKSMKA